MGINEENITKIYVDVIEDMCEETSNGLITGRGYWTLLELKNIDFKIFKYLNV